MTSHRTEAAIGRAKARGKGLAQKNKTQADEFAEGLRPVVERLQEGGAGTVAELVSAMNAEGVETARGGRWHPATVPRLLARLKTT